MDTKRFRLYADWLRAERMGDMCPGPESALQLPSSLRRASVHRIRTKHSMVILGPSARLFSLLATRGMSIRKIVELFPHHDAKPQNAMRWKREPALPISAQQPTNPPPKPHGELSGPPGRRPSATGNPSSRPAVQR